MKKNPYNRQYTGQDSVSQAITSKSGIPQRLVKCLLEKDNWTLAKILRKRPKLIYKIDNVDHIYFPQWGPFRVFLINKLYLLYEGEKLIFFSSCREVVQWNLNEWHYYFEQERKNNQAKKTGTS